jgi:uncharacterized protein YndB with AHSA1/START domain
MATLTAASQSKPSKRAVAFTRMLDASPERVFRAWTDPELLARWWGPNGFTNPVCEVDARPGGDILIHMQGPDGVVYPMTGIFQEVNRPARIVFTSCAFFAETKDEPQITTLDTVTLAEHDGGTVLGVRAVVVRSTPAAAGALAGMEEGWRQSLDRLEALLAGQ